MSFVAAPPPSTPAPAVIDTVAGDGWYPDLSIAAFRSAMRIESAVTDLRVREALIGGFLTAEGDLRDWRAQQAGKGVAQLLDIEGQLAGENRAGLLWRRAVHAFAAADLAETQNNITATNDGRDRNAEPAVSSCDHRRNGIAAVRDLIGRRRARIKLL